MSIPKTEIISQSEAAYRAGISPTTLRKLEETAEFPLRIHLTTKRIGYVADEIDKWIEWKIAERDQSTEGASL